MGVVIPLNEPAKQEPGIDALVALTLSDMEKVNQIIVAMAGSNVKLIPEIANHLISSGGKRLRPMLTIAAAQMCGGRGDDYVKLAASVEFMHTATLLHDDVVDESDIRRGKPTAHKLWGNQASVLVGDFLLGQAFKKMVEARSLEALKILSNAAAVISEGEVLQLSIAKNLMVTEDEYLTVISAKTASLFAAATTVGPVLANRPQADQSAFYSYGLNLGYAFQLIDDALDYGGIGTQLGKRIGDDLREGKITLPVILAFRRGNDEDRAFWKKCIGNTNVTEEDLKHAITLMTATDAIGDTIERARHYGAIASDALAPFPACELKSALLDVVQFSISRVN